MKGRNLPIDLEKAIWTERIFSHPDFLAFVSWNNAIVTDPEKQIDPSKHFTYDTPEGMANFIFYLMVVEEGPWRKKSLVGQRKARNGYNMCPLCKSNRKAWYAKKCRQCFLATK